MNHAPEKSEALDERQLSLLKIQYSEVGTQFRTVWDLYLKFYIAFMALNFTALGLVVQYMDRHHRGPIVVCFSIQNILSAATACGVGVYSRLAARQQQAIIDAHLAPERREIGQPLEFQSPVPSQLASWGSSANALSQFLFIGCWIASISVGPTGSPPDARNSTQATTVIPSATSSVPVGLPGAPPTNQHFNTNPPP
jgi:hypothetical protein